MDKVISLEEVYCNKIMSNVLDMALDLEEEGVVWNITNRELRGLLNQFYHLYKTLHHLILDLHLSN